MDLHKIIEELQVEKRRLDEAIEALERLSGGGSHRRGRPPRKSELSVPEEDSHAESSAASVQS